MVVIEIQSERPKNKEHFSRLLDFCEAVVAICSELGISPVLNGSLAVFGYTMHEAMKVNDIDLACSELEFSRIIYALDANEITHELKEWHVLQALKYDLKVELDSIEYWMQDLPDEFNTLVIDGHRFKVVSLSSLKELFRRGLEATTSQNDEAVRAKYAAIQEKYKTLCTVQN